MTIRMDKDGFFEWLHENLEEAASEADVDDGALELQLPNGQVVHVMAGGSDDGGWWGGGEVGR
jgi:hypothetical protein